MFRSIHARDTYNRRLQYHHKNEALCGVIVGTYVAKYELACEIPTYMVQDSMDNKEALMTAYDTLVCLYSTCLVQCTISGGKREAHKYWSVGFPE